MTATMAPPQSELTFAKGKGTRKIKNSAATGLVWLAFGIALVPLIWLLYTVISKGYHAIVQTGWFTSDQAGISFSVKGGGVSAAIIGTAEQVALCTVISVPIAILVGVYLVEYGRGPFAKLTTFMVDILTGIPSIVAALFIYALFITTLGGDRAGWLVSLALVILMIPVIVRTTEEMLRLVPNELREASYALGIPKWRTIIKVVIPTAFTGLVTGVVLGIARVAGETAPLLILVGYSGNTNTDLFNNFQSSLPGFINNQAINLTPSGGGTGKVLDPETGQLVAGKAVNFAPDRLWGAALTLIIIVMALNLIARLIGRRNKIAN
ncbi:phosphate ABC transporter permease PstA [uncultured Jatrophihabitans sp.]|uniref:phosphate ABC transporter permease PstA n=1 Tax=uncultured Jatrophihabitans sp. TaxID=1610747 RepID=UPI0035CC266E